MSRVLIVDDEQDFRDLLSLCLWAEDHEVCATQDGRSAIEIGVRFRPEVLVVDWLLKDDVHGLHVAQALRVVHPGTQTVLITGFGSPELASKAQALRVYELVEKPFEPDRIMSAVRAAASADRGAAPPALAVPAMEVGPAGEIVYANPAAASLGDARTVGELFNGDAVPDLDRAAADWLPARHGSRELLLRSRPLSEGGHLLIAVPREQDELSSHPLLRMLVEPGEPFRSRWPFAGRVLLIDPDELVRRFAFNLLERAGCFCHVAGDCRSGLRLLRRDEGIRFVVLDHDLPPADVAAFARAARAVRPMLTIVGTGSGEPAERGTVERFLPKPWRTEDLVDVLTDRLGACDKCGATLPLRHPLPDEASTDWECVGCGKRFAALPDETADPAARDAVRSLETLQ